MALMRRMVFGWVNGLVRDKQRDQMTSLEGYILRNLLRDYLSTMMHDGFGERLYKLKY